MGEKLAGPEDECGRGAMTPRLKKQIDAVNAYYTYKWKQLTTAFLVNITLFVAGALLFAIYFLYGAVVVWDQGVDPTPDGEWHPVVFVMLKGFGFMTLFLLVVATPISVFLYKMGTRKYMARWATLTPEEKLLYIDWMRRTDRAYRAARV